MAKAKKKWKVGEGPQGNDLYGRSSEEVAWLKSKGWKVAGSNAYPWKDPAPPNATQGLFRKHEAAVACQKRRDALQAEVEHLLSSGWERASKGGFPWSRPGESKRYTHVGAVFAQKELDAAPPEPKATIGSLPLRLDLIEARARVAIEEASESLGTLRQVLRDLQEIRGSRPLKVHYAEGVGDHGMGAGFYTDEDFDRAQRGE